MTDNGAQPSSLISFIKHYHQSFSLSVSHLLPSNSCESSDVEDSNHTEIVGDGINSL